MRKKTAENISRTKMNVTRSQSSVICYNRSAIRLWNFEEYQTLGYVSEIVRIFS